MWKKLEEELKLNSSYEEGENELKNTTHMLVKQLVIQQNCNSLKCVTALLSALQTACTEQEQHEKAINWRERKYPLKMRQP